MQSACERALLFKRDRLVVYLTALLVLSIGALASTADAHARQSPVLAWTEKEVEAVLNRVEESRDFEAAGAELNTILSALVIYAPASEAEAFRKAAVALRIVETLAVADPTIRVDTLRFLRRSPRFAEALVYLMPLESTMVREAPGGLGWGVESLGDRSADIRNIYRVLRMLREDNEDRIETFANLAAAVCVVHRTPVRMRVNENTGVSPGPVAVFRYFVRNERRMLFGVRDMPPELLAFVVDVAASIEEMEWALSRHQGDRQVGRRFFDIRYDMEHYRRGVAKRVNEAGWNLPNIRTHGGICADQAYFACTVGKSIGVPAVFTSGRGSQTAHAWVGFLEQRGRQIAWNFDNGRYDEYKGVRGRILDPVAGGVISDGYLSLLADFASVPEIRRRHAGALTDAAALLSDEIAGPQLDRRVMSGGAPWNDAAQPVRTPGLDARLELTETALRLCPAYLPAWRQIHEMCFSSGFGYAHKSRWAGIASRLCGRDHPDFLYDTIMIMISTEQDHKTRYDLLESSANMFGRRLDLAAGIRLEQGRILSRQGNQNQAWRMYQGVIAEFANEGRWAIYAANELEKMLVAAGRPASEVAEVWERVHRSSRRPSSSNTSPFASQSNWAQSGQKYAQWLERAGRSNDAQRVRRQLGG